MVEGTSALVLGSGEAFGEGEALDVSGGVSGFFASRLEGGVLTSFSMAVARDLGSSELLDEGGGRGGGERGSLAGP